MPLTIHFLNVGHGDCTIVEFPSGHRTMIDINNSRVLDEDTARELAIASGASVASFDLYRSFGLKLEAIERYERENLTDPVEFYLSRYGRVDLFRFVLTHPDMDHMTGLHCLRSVEGVRITNLWDTQHSVSKSEDPDDWESTQFDLRDWQEYRSARESSSDPKVLHLLQGASGEYYSADGISVWWPIEHRPETDESSDINQLSYVLEIRYGECRIVLGGDAPISVWQALYEQCGGQYPKVHLLKAPHHGRKSGYDWRSVRSMDPDYTVVSVGKLLKKEDAFAGYERYSRKGCYSTRFEGDIRAQCWADGDVWLYDRAGRRLP